MKFARTRELTGRKVLLWLIGFFVLVFAVNAVMVHAAISTFGGVDTPSSYKAGQLFEGDVARAERQDALHWQVAGKLKRDGGGEAVLDISVRDAQGKPVTGLSADARLMHPADERLDHVIAVARIGAGQFHGESRAMPGRWQLIVDLYRDGNRMFRSVSDVTLR